MTISDIAALVVIIGFAFFLGVSDAPNSSAALIASRTTSYRGAMAFSFVFHVIGGFVAGQAVALTMLGLVHVSHGELGVTYIAGGISSLAFTFVATRHGIPTSASIALVGGLAGAAAVTAGWHGVGWGGFHGARPYGVIGTIAGIVISPVVGAFAAGGVRRLLNKGLRRATRKALPYVRVSIWLSAGLVALADGSNDGQKAMGLATAVLVAAGTISTFAVPLWVTALVAVVLAAGTAAGGKQIVRTVSSRFYRGGPLDGLATEGASAAVILGAAFLGAPVSTSTVVASGMVGTGASRRRHHVQWRAVRSVVSAWVITVPACALIGAGLAGLARLVGALR
ncbi:MAG: inorganic phosphate transporter [Acidimicrobiales bacterium]